MFFSQHEPPLEMVASLINGNPSDMFAFKFLEDGLSGLD
jgi:hypothetical protein